LFRQAGPIRRYGPDHYSVHGLLMNVGLLSTMTNSDWPFDQPRNCAVITLRPIVFDGAPILQVVHDEDDHGWQFLGWDDADVDRAAVVALETIVKLDPSVLEVADLPPGWRAWRRSESSPWTRERLPADGE
jgi:hypothetical protein